MRQLKGHPHKYWGKKMLNHTLTRQQRWAHFCTRTQNKKKHEKQAPYSGNTQKKNLLFSGRRSSKVWKKEDDVFKTPTPIHTYTQKYIVFLLFLSSFKKKKTSLLKRHREKQKSPNKKKAVFQGKRSLLTTTTCFLKKKKRRKRTPLWDTEKKKLHHSRE